MGEVKEEVASFVQNYDGKVNGLKKTFNISREEIKNNFLHNQEIVKEAVSSSEQKYSKISSTISELYQKINEISKKQEEQNSSGSDVNNLKIRRDLEVDGLMSAKKINTNGVNLGNIQFTPQTIKVTGDSKIQFGNKVIPFENILKELSYVDRLMNHCGKNFENCKVVEDSKIMETNRQSDLLKSLKRLKMESSELLRRRRR